MEDARTLASRKRRRRVLVVLLLLVGVPLLLVGGALLFVQSSAGSALIKQKVLAAVSGALAGKVEAKQVELKGNHVVLTGLQLFTPEGELVASIERVEADVELAGLTHQQLHLEHVTVQAPKLMLKEDERGWNLLRAVTLKSTSPLPATPAAPTAWKLQFDGVELSDGLFDLEQEGRRITATKLAAKGDAKIRLEPLEISGSLAFSSALTAPLEEALEATVAASATQGPQNYDVAVTLGGSRLRAHAELPSLAFTIDELVAAPREVSAFLPAWPIKPTVYGKGTLSLKQAALELKAGKARVSLEAKYSLPGSSAETLAVRGADVDFQELLGAPLASSLAFDASGAIKDWRPATLNGALKATATWDAKGGQRLASAQLNAAADKGTLKVRNVEVLSPGLRLNAHATASQAALTAFATLEAKDLSQLARTLHTFANVDIAGLGGNGTVRVSLMGPLRWPAAKVVGQFNQFSIVGIGAQKLELTADVPDLSLPLDTDVLLHAQRINLGDRVFDEATFDFLTHGRELDVDLATKGLGDLRVHAIGLLDKDARGTNIKTLELTSTDAHWALDAPTRVDWGDGVTIDPFSLRDGAQHLAGQLRLTHTKMEGRALIEQLDLARAPRALAPPALELGGILSADATVTGKPSKPSVTVTAQLSGGRVKGFEALDAQVKASWIDERAKGSLTLSSDLGKLDGVFDVPVIAFLEEKPGEGTAHFSVKDVPTSKLEHQLGRKLPADGVLSALVDLSGSGDHPKVRVTVESAALKIPAGEQTLEVKDARLEAFTTDDATLGATLHFSSLGAQSAVTLATPLTIASLRKHLPAPKDLLELPLELGLEVKKLNLKQLDEQHFVRDDELAGEVSLTGSVKGSVKAPTGELTVTVEDVTWPPLRKTNAQLTLSTDASHTRLNGTASMGEQQQGLELKSSISALPARALAALFAPNGNADTLVDALREVPLEVLLVLQPFALSKAVVNHENEALPGGVLSATLQMDGTLEAPTARLVGTLQDLKFDRVALGSARFDLKSTGTQQQYTVALGGQGRDDFKAKGTLGLDLRLSALRHGLDWRAAPVDLSLESRHFDLGFLSGATDLLRVVGGRLNLAGHVGGTLGKPHFLGDATVRDGRLALAGFGDYRELSLDAHADDNRVDVKQLKVTSGAGSAELVASAVRQPSGNFALTSTGSTDKFPIVVDDQLVASVSLRYGLAGDITSSLVDIHKLELPRVDVALPEVKRKDLQDLQRPKDIIILRSGMRASQRRRQAAKDAVAADAANSAQPLVIRALLDAPRNIWVRSSDLNVELGLSEGFRVEFNDGLRLFGEVKLLKGNVAVIGREFTVQSGSEARFAGPPAQPYLNVSALHVNSREQVKITVTVAGRGTDLGFKVASEPPMPESDIYAVLATGRRNLKTSGGASFTPGQAASVVGQLAASQLKTVIAKKLPIDVFNFETTDNFEKVKLDVGKYLSDTVYLGGSVDIGAKRERGENVWSGRIELQLTKSISLEAYAGDALSFGADAMWSRDF